MNDRFDQEVVSADRSDPTMVDARLAEAMEAYLAQLESGKLTNVKEFAARFPDIADELETCLTSLDFVHGAGWALAAQHSLVSPDSRGSITLGEYRLIKEIGRGGMGVVYEAEQLSLGRHVAVKVLPFAALLDPRQLQRFKNEARAAAMLKHPRIVSVHSIGYERGVHFYAMELIDGLSLAEVVHSRKVRGKESHSHVATDSETCPIATVLTRSAGDGRRFYREVARLGAHVAEAIHYAHTEGVIHRDIKPSNLLLESNGNVHITDFGLARIKTNDDLTLSGDVVGTLRYMSPEQLAAKPVDARTDVFGLGLSLYELATGVAARQADRRGELTREILDSPLRLPSAIDASIPRDLETVILKATANDPSERYDSAEDFRADLQRLLQDHPVLARRATRVERARRWAVHNPLLSALLGTVVVLLTTLAIGSTLVAWKLHNESRQKEQALYAKDIRLAQQSIAEGNLADAERILLKTTPEDLSHDHRGFEWFHLWQTCHDPAIQRTISHPLSTSSVAFLSDSRIAIGGFGSKTRVWDLPLSRHSQPRLELKGPNFQIVALRSIPETNLLLTGDGDGNVVLWDRDSGQVVQSIDVGLPPPHDFVSCLAVDNEDKRIAIGVGTRTSGAVCVWDLEQQAFVAKLDGFSGYCRVAFVADGSLFVTSQGDSRIQVYEPASWQKTDELGLEADGVRHIAISPDRHRIALSLYEEHGEYTETRIDEWQTTDRHLLHRLRLDGPLRHSLCYGPDGTLLACGGADGSIVLLDNRFHVMARRKAHNGCIRAIDISPDGKQLATAGDDGNVHLWSVSQLLDSAGSVTQFDVQSSIHGVGFLDDDRACVISDRGDLSIWNDRSGELIESIHVDAWNSNCNYLSVSDDRQFAAAVLGHWPPQDTPGHLQLVDLTTRKKIYSTELPHGLVFAHPAFSPNNRYLAVSCKQNAVVFDLVERRMVQDIAFDGWVKAADFSPDGQTLILSSKGDLHVYEVPSFKQRTSWTADEAGIVNCARFSPDGKTLAVAGLDRHVKLFDGESFKPTGTSFPTVDGYLVDVSFSPDGARLLTGGVDGKVRLWHVETGEELLSFDVETSWYPTCRFSPSGDAIVIGCGYEAMAIHGADRRRLKRLTVAELTEIACQDITEN